MAQEQPPWLPHLSQPTAYPGPVTSVELVQTHISWVFITDSMVFKLKKPVDFGFLDFTTLDKRRHFCQEEVRLNRRLCPSIYKGVWAVVEEGGSYRLVEESRGRPVAEWAVAMERMDTRGIMTSLLEEGRLEWGHLERVVERLVPFYRGAEGGPEVERYGRLDAVRFNTDENFQQTREFVGKLISSQEYQAIQGYTDGFYARRARLFQERVEQGAVRDGHGDLYSANICFDETRGEVFIFDCIEFNRRFRCGDWASDAAFLAMDLDFHGLPHLSRRLVEALAQGLEDPTMEEVIPFYKCYRAYVRGKIGCFTWAAPGIAPEEREQWADRARRYFRLALRYAGGLERRPNLYLFMGPTGSGKSTVASLLGERLRVPVFNSDGVRKEMVARIPATQRCLEPVGQGIYSPEMTLRTYRLLHQQAGARLMVGEDAVIDATYTSPEMRREVVELAAAAGARLRPILCQAPEEEVRRRLQERMAGESVSDGRWEIYLAQRPAFRELPEFSRVERLNTTAPPQELVEALLREE